MPKCCYIIKEWLFYFNHFSLIIFFHSVRLGFELSGLNVQVHRIGYCLRSREKDMTITIVMITLRQEMELECGCRHVQKRLAENFEVFEKESVKVRPWCWEGEVRPWCWESGVRPWCWEFGVRTCSWGFETEPCKQTIEFLPLW